MRAHVRRTILAVLAVAAVAVAAACGGPGEEPDEVGFDQPAPDAPPPDEPDDGSGAGADDGDDGDEAAASDHALPDAVTDEARQIHRTIAAVAEEGELARLADLEPDAVRLERGGEDVAGAGDALHSMLAELDASVAADLVAVLDAAPAHTTTDDGRSAWVWPAAAHLSPDELDEAEVDDLRPLGDGAHEHVAERGAYAATSVRIAADGSWEAAFVEGSGADAAGGEASPAPVDDERTDLADFHRMGATVELSDDGHGAHGELVDVRVSGEDDRDRIVWELTGADGLPAVFVDSDADGAYTPGKGERVDLAGERIVTVGVSGTDVRLDDDGAEPTYDGPDVIEGADVGASYAAEVRNLGSHHGTISLAIGVDDADRFDVEVLADPARVVVELAEAP